MKLILNSTCPQHYTNCVGDKISPRVPLGVPEGPEAPLTLTTRSELGPPSSATSVGDKISTWVPQVDLADTGIVKNEQTPNVTG